MPDVRTVSACVIIIGNEILSGRTQDANLPYLAKALNSVGIRVMEARVVPRREARHRRGGERLPRRVRLRIHHRRDRPDPRRHHLRQHR